MPVEVPVEEKSARELYHEARQKVREALEKPATIENLLNMQENLFAARVSFGVAARVARAHEDEGLARHAEISRRAVKELARSVYDVVLPKVGKEKVPVPK